jgi:hypothetical protein
MTPLEIITYLSRHSYYLLGLFIIIPLLAAGYGKIHANGRGIFPPHKFIYAALIYISAIPGIFSTVITGYSLFILRVNLLNVNFIIYFLPILSMTATMILIRKNVDLDHIPGFDRLYGLFILLAVTFILALIIVKTRIWLFFGGSIITIFGVIIFLFFLLKWASYTLFRGSAEKKIKPPQFPKV